MVEPALGEELLRLASADNFRDVAGPDTAYVASDGTPLRRGVAYRSNELQLTDVDAATIAGLGVSAIYDLRSQHEVEAHPDAEIAGATWHHLEVRGIPMSQLRSLTSHEAADAVMRSVYRSFVEVPGARAAFGELLRHVAEAEDGAILFHCAAGKDRTGWAAALLLHIAGVDDATILDDYLLTNSFSSATREKYLGLVREHLGADKVSIYETAMLVDGRFLQEAYDAIAERYGDRTSYLRDGLGLDEATLAKLRARLRG
ncbi:MAG TPA: tyrosine-protein phosphatase [Nocardioides sp.]|uniref:tyrosine-protein phosphatase n=1 Tax=uncultured Nocardioides sp. TaxID=198441 RepID=UPI000EC75139|nr:tyrosine-protein phosphatase [uncultured Nocardioides sp.]HCB04879.1 protein-tyrosine-phosphatase [Nocardioides sp.]HRD62655.1 tyrosine-protein phosphatase [Nocardioides sp.]HRI97409.1 tyrosine-protein phosphatase [Nocardioides sp.]HRK46129.1 tyrosine-protein phosphatase [Nocardioides sp.]